MRAESVTDSALVICRLTPGLLPEPKREVYTKLRGCVKIFILTQPLDMTVSQVCLLKGFVFRAEHSLDFVLIEFLHVVASRAEVFAGVKFSGIKCEDFADSGGHGQTAVGVDVDFADSAFGSFAELFFGNTDCIGKFATVLVDGFNFFLRN